MSHLGRIPHLARFLAALAVALLGLAVSVPAAFAMRVPAPGGSSGFSPTGPRPTLTHAVISSAMPGWQVTVIVAVVAVLAATIAIVVERARAARRIGTVPAT
jgi:hypothetical protein